MKTVLGHHGKACWQGIGDGFPLRALSSNQRPAVQLGPFRLLDRADAWLLPVTVDEAHRLRVGGDCPHSKLGRPPA